PAAAEDDRDRRRDRRGAFRGFGFRYRGYRPWLLHHLRPLRRIDHHGDADARRDGRRQPVDRIVRRLFAQRVGQLGRLLGGLSVLVLLGERRGLRGDRRREDHPVLGPRPRVAVRAGPVGLDDGAQTVLRVVVRRIRVLVRRPQGGR